MMITYDDDDDDYRVLTDGLGLMGENLRACRWNGVEVCGVKPIAINASLHGVLTHCMIASRSLWCAPMHLMKIKDFGVR